MASKIASDRLLQGARDLVLAALAPVQAGRGRTTPRSRSHRMRLGCGRAVVRTLGEARSHPMRPCPRRVEPGSHPMRPLLWPRSARASGAPAFVAWSGMTGNSTTYPYDLEVIPCQRSLGRFEWAIRKHGKLAERSDRSYPSEQAARQDGQGAIDRQLRGDHEPARRAPRR